MIRRIEVLCLIVCLFTKIYSQGGFEALARLGYTDFDYSLPAGQKRGGIGFGGHIGYSFFFSKKVGLGLGANFYRYASHTNRRYTEFVPNAKDSQGHTCDITTFYEDKSRISATYLGLPLSLRVWFPIGRKFFILTAVGAAYNIAFLGKYHTESILEKEEGYYPQWHLTLHDVHEYGQKVIRTSNQSPTLKNTVTVFGRADYGIKLGKSLHLLVGLECTYGLLHSVDFENVGKKVLPFAVNVEFGCQYIIPKKRSRWCHCATDN